MKEINSQICDANRKTNLRTENRFANDRSFLSFASHSLWFPIHEGVAKQVIKHLFLTLSVKSLMVEKLVQATISSLGYLEDGVYFREPDCFDSVRDLIRLIHGDDKEKLTVRRICTGRNIVKNDLVPIMKSKDISDELFDASLRLADNEAMQIYHEAETNLVRSLGAFTDNDIFKVLAKKSHDYFSLEWEDRTEKQKLLVERIFVLIRYVFAIGTESGKNIKASELDGPLKEKVIKNFFDSDFPKILMGLSKNSMEKEFCLYVLSIFALIFKNFNSRTLAMKEADFALAAKEKVEEELAELINSKRRCVSGRSFMRGTFNVKGVKALNTQNDLLIRRSSILNTENPLEKQAMRKHGKRLRKAQKVDDLEENNVDKEQGITNRQILDTVKEFCTNLLDDGAYNRLMKTTRDLAFSNARSLTHKYSEVYFFSLAKFIMEFARIARFRCEKVAATFSSEFYYHVLSFVNTSLENIKIDRQQLKLHAFKLQYAVSVYKEMMITLNSIVNAIDPAEKQLCANLCDLIFQVEEFRELGYSMLNTLTPATTTRKMLEDLILANHYYIHVMETISKRGQLDKVNKLKRKSKAKLKMKKKASAESKIDKVKEEEVFTEETLSSLWDEISEELSATLLGDLKMKDDVNPIDNLLKVDDDKHQAFSLVKIQMALKNREVAEAVGLYRAARDMWPETGTFGDDDVSPEQEFLDLNELLHSDLSELAASYKAEIKRAYGTDSRVKMELYVSGDEDDEMPSHGDNDSDAFEDGQSQYEVDQIAFDFNEYVTSYSKPHMILWYTFLLRTFESNASELNKALLKVFFSALYFLYHTSFIFDAPSDGFRLEETSAPISGFPFRVFERVHNLVIKFPEESRKEHRFYDLDQFGYHLFEKFLKEYNDLEDGSVLVCELLFSKTFSDEIEIEK
uniref:Timeless N-terminal domain-containing protein n=1 Tax=Ditylenchus dipsaci TaxID=166011 RepID=A0A915DZF1_9BILA